MAAGFLYVLINPSMPGMAKVGKTTRDPSDRVNELSGATGVATPFILAYQQPVADCRAAETWVHAQLELKGQRVASNREFFNAPLHEIVALVSQAVNVGSADSSPGVQGKATKPDATVAEELIALGQSYMDGDGVIENKATALKYFSQASALGDQFGSLSAGICLHFGGQGLRPDLERAIEFYRKAISQGNWLSHRYVATAFLQAGSKQNALPEWRALFEKGAKEAGRNSMQHRHVGQIIPASACDYLRLVATNAIPHVVPNDQILLFRTEIAAALEKERNKGRNYAENYKALKFLEGLS